MIDSNLQLEFAYGLSIIIFLKLRTTIMYIFLYIFQEETQVLLVDPIGCPGKLVQLISKCISGTFGFCHSIESGFLLRYTNFGLIGSFPS